MKAIFGPAAARRCSRPSAVGRFVLSGSESPGGRLDCGLGAVPLWAQVFDMRAAPLDLP